MSLVNKSVANCLKYSKKPAFNHQIERKERLIADRFTGFRQFCLKIAAIACPGAVITCCRAGLRQGNRVTAGRLSARKWLK
jgi:hypothetical protein